MIYTSNKQLDDISADWQVDTKQRNEPNDEWILSLAIVSTYN